MYCVIYYNFRRTFVPYNGAQNPAAYPSFLLDFRMLLSVKPVAFHSERFHLR